MGANLNIDCNEHLDDRQEGFLSSDGYTINTLKVKAKEGTNIVVQITCNAGYDPNTIVVTEKGGKGFTKAVEYANRDNDNGGDNKLELTLPYSQNIDYDFEITYPTPLYKEIGFSPISADTLTQTENAALKEVVENTQVYVLNENGTAEFADLTVVSGGNRKFNLDGKKLKSDLSQEKFEFFVRFDKTNPQRVIYQNYQEIFAITSEDYSSPRTAETEDVVYCQIPGTELYGFKYSFDMRHYRDDLKVILNEQAFTRVDYPVDYVKPTINKSITAYTFRDGSKYQYYKFNLENCMIDGTETDLSGNIQKEYGKEYKLTYKINEQDITASISDSEDAAVKETENNERKAALWRDTDFSKIKFTVNGKVLDTSKVKYTAAVGVNPHRYEITFAATEVSTDFGGTNINELEIGVDETSIVSKIGVKTNGTTYDDNAYLFSNNGQHSVYSIITGDSVTVSKGYENIGDLKQFKLKVTLGNQSYQTEVLKSGVDYQKLLTEGNPDGLENLNVLSDQSMNWKYLLGSEGDTTSNYISYELQNNSIDIRAFVTGLTELTEIKFEILETEEQTMPVVVEGVELSEPMKLVYNNTEVPNNEINLSYDYDYEVIIPNYEDKVTGIKLYSNGVVFATLPVDFNGKLELNGWASDYEAYAYIRVVRNEHGEGDTSLELQIKNRDIYLSKDTGTKDESNNSIIYYATVRIDKVAIVVE